ncbi:MAG TPA: CBS domain-containing protein [Actinomycetes bacterium]|jgi:CBS domain-containing protein|nr:CBS domain-containing protein [Actinomycetes bacterium]
MRRKVEDVMTTEVVTVRRQEPFKSIVRLLEECRISAVPVVDDRGVVIGVVSEADLLAKERYPHGRAGLSTVEGLRNRTALHKAKGVTAAELMSSPPVTVQLGSTVGEAARLCAGAGVKRLPVVDGRGRLVGVVTRTDLLKVFMRQDEEIRREVAELIHPGVWASPLAVDVTVADGVVTLRGQVQRRSFVAVITRMAEAVDGVVKVERELGWDMDDTVLPPLPAAPLGR